MSASAYLKNLLTTSSTHRLTDDEKSLIEKSNIENFIYSKLTSKKFRKFKMDPACVERTKVAINSRVTNNEPIHVVYPQGGYKLWRLPSTPTVDWAEFFNISYLLEYTAPIAASYTPGVQITYYMHTLLMELHDNLTTEEIQAYVDSFEKLLEEFRKYLPKNITISILRDADIYTRSEYFEALENGRTKAEEEYKGWNQIRRDKFEKMANLNIKWNGKEDWTKLSDKEKKEKIYLAALYESAATSQLSKVAERVKSSSNVLVFTSSSPAFIGIGSTRASMAKFWVGFGVLEKRDDKYLSIVLTPKQYEEVMKIEHKEITVNLLNHSNFEEILVFDKPFNFSRR